MSPLPSQASPLIGLPFSDPTQGMPMPDGWQEKPIRYEERLAGYDLVLTLDQQVYQILTPIIEQFAAENHIKVAIRKGTCGISGGMLDNKRVDMAGFCCAPGQIDRFPGLRFHTLGIGAIAIFTHPSNPIRDISLTDLRAIYQGERYRWSEVNKSAGKNSHDLPIRTVGRLHCKLRPGHWRLLLNNGDLFSPRMLEVGTIADMILQVASFPEAIGYETIWHVDRYRQQGKVQPLTIDAISHQDTQALAQGRYPLYRTFNITTWEGNLANPHADRLVTHLLKMVENLAPHYGLVPASHLRKTGWQFMGNELIGKPVSANPSP
ncbi:MAG: hypothetical protein HQL52_09435 [Magnetococcales bacterium]|nr:hypothetical protein [Magnetococcales bacterium]